MKNEILASAKVALVAFSSLGDGLIYLMMAENLRRNGFAITYFGDVGFQLHNWMPQLNILPYPEKEKFDDVLQSFDLVLISPPQWMREEVTDPRIRGGRDNWVLMCQKAPQAWAVCNIQNYKSNLNSHIAKQIDQLINCSFSIRKNAVLGINVVDQTIHFMRERMHLSNLSKWVELTPPKHLKHKKFKKRIIVSPDSAGPEKKNWTPSRFLKLCKQLHKQGYDPKVVVAPSHYDIWYAYVNNEFEMPFFNNIGDLAAYVFESGGLIANDSGNGHLASFLKVPVVTIYRKRKSNFYWRPGWGVNAVVSPMFTVPWIGGPVWKPFVRIGQVINRLERLLTI